MRSLMRSFGVFFVQSLCAACVASANPCETIPAGSDASECKPSDTFVLKKPPPLDDPDEAPENSYIKLHTNRPDFDGGLQPSLSETLPSARPSEKFEQKAAEIEQPSKALLFTYSKTPREKIIPPPCSEVSTGGGDQPEKHEINFRGRAGPAKLIWNTYAVMDQLKLYIDKVLIHDTGCVGELKGKEFDIPKGARSVQVEVIPNCEGTEGTAWEFKVFCPP